MSHRSLLRGAAAGAILCLQAAASWAGTFTISPLRVELSQQAGTAALTVRNEEQAPVIVQASALQWEQAAGTDALSPTRDVLVSPAVFTIPPGGSQLVRIALRRDVDPVRELSYRLLLDEVPPVAAPEFRGLQVALRLSLPIFVAPRTRAKPELDWSAARTADGDLTVTLRNDGQAHIQVQGFTLTPPGAGAKPLQQPIPAYVLPGQSRSWTLPQGARQLGAARQMRLTGLSDTGDVSTEIRLTDR